MGCGCNKKKKNEKPADKVSKQKILVAGNRKPKITIKNKAKTQKKDK